RVKVDNTRPVTWGMPEYSDIYFNNNPVFRLSADAVSKGTLKPLIWFSDPLPLRSGWAWGQAYLQDGVSAFEATMGRGSLLVFGAEVTFRAKTHGTFKLLFNQLYALK